MDVILKTLDDYIKKSKHSNCTVIAEFESDPAGDAATWSVMHFIFTVNNTCKHSLYQCNA